MHLRAGSLRAWVAGGLFALTTQLREGIIQAEPEAQLEGVIETDEVYIVT
jgi:hypothetical protein